MAICVVGHFGGRACALLALIARAFSQIRARVVPRVLHFRVLSLCMFNWVSGASPVNANSVCMCTCICHQPTVPVCMCPRAMRKRSRPCLFCSLRSPSNALHSPSNKEATKALWTLHVCASSLCEVKDCW